jgi:hypothetical protein
MAVRLFQGAYHEYVTACFGASAFLAEHLDNRGIHCVVKPDRLRLAIHAAWRSIKSEKSMQFKMVNFTG